MKLNLPKTILQLAALAAFLAAPAFGLSSYGLNILIMMFFYGYLATAWNILGGFAGQHSLGHAAFVGIGAYTSTLLLSSFGLSPWIGMLIGAIVAGGFGLLLGYAAFRCGLKGPFFLLLTIAAAMIVMLIVLNVRSLGGASGIVVPFGGSSPLYFQFESKIAYYYTALGFLLGAIFLSYKIRQGRLGFYFIAIRENEDAAEALGINALKYKLIATYLSAFLSAIGGTFYAQYFFFIDPESILSIGVSVEILIYPILGGIGTVLGPVVGTFVLFPVGELARYFWGGAVSGIHLLFYGGFLMIAIIFLPEGIIGLFRKIAKG